MFRGGRGRGRAGRAGRGRGRGASTSAARQPVERLSSVAPVNGSALQQAAAKLLQQQDVTAPRDAVEAVAAQAAGMTVTQNGAITLASSGHAATDLFFRLARGATVETTQELFAAAWKQSPEDAIRIVFHARDIRDGKAERDVVFVCLLWIRLHKPRTYLQLLPHVLQFGSFKDLVTLAHMVAFAERGDMHFGLDIPVGKRKWHAVKERKKAERKSRRRAQEDKSAAAAAVNKPQDEVMKDAYGRQQQQLPDGGGSSEEEEAEAEEEVKQPLDVATEWKSLGAVYPELVLLAAALEADAAALDKWEKRRKDGEFELVDASETAQVRTLACVDGNGSPVTVHVHGHQPSVVVQVPTASADNSKPRISLAAKWAPTQQHSDDVQDGFAGTLAKLLFPDVKLQQRQRMRLYRKLLVRLRQHLQIVEHQTTTSKWDEIVYSQLPSRAHFRYKKAFIKHTEARYTEYLGKLEKKQEERAAALAAPLAAAAAEESKEEAMEDADEEEVIKMNSTALLPHELIMDIIRGDEPTAEELEAIADAADNGLENPFDALADQKKAESKTAAARQREAMWNELVLKIKEEGTFKNALAVVDVSGSMFQPNHIPISVAVALGMLLSSCTDEPWKDRILTFSESPKFHMIEGATLKERVTNLMSAEWGMSTNLIKAMEMILVHAKRHQLPQSSMPSLLLIISDMQFNSASHGHTNFQDIDRMYREAGYERSTLAFWNVNSLTCNDSPVSHDENGTVLLSGYSPSVMKTLLNKPEDGQSLVSFLRTLTPSKMLDKILAPYSATVDLSGIIDPSDR